MCRKLLAPIRKSTPRYAAKSVLASEDEISGVVWKWRQNVFSVKQLSWK
jgi:hypothetical protein